MGAKVPDKRQGDTRGHTHAQIREVLKANAEYSDRLWRRPWEALAIWPLMAYGIKLYNQLTDWLAMLLERIIRKQ